MRSIAIAMSLLAGCAAYAENPTFEVASIKPAAPQEMNRIMVQMGGTPGRLDYKNVSLREMVRAAYGVKDYQVVAPDWMSSARFDVEARYNPPDAPQETRNLMLQALLAERFGLKVHKESKETSVYNLVVAKGGPKLKKAEDGPMPAPPKGASDDRPGSEPKMGAGIAGAPAPKGGPGGGGRGMMRIGMEGTGKMHLEAKSTTTAQFSDFLARQVGKPVIDETGLTGNYDVDIEFKPEMGGGMMRGGPGPMPRPEGGGPAPDAVEAPSIFTAIQDQLGLKLESKKGAVETVVVDHANRTPTEN